MSYFDGCRNRTEIKARYHDLCMEHHPDRATIVMQKINSEYAEWKTLSDAELSQRADRLKSAISHFPKRQAEPAPAPPSPSPARSTQPARKSEPFKLSPKDLKAIAEQARLANLPGVPAWYDLDQRRAYDRAQQERNQRARDIDLNEARRAEQDEIERQQAEARSALARTMPRQG